MNTLDIENLTKTFQNSQQPAVHGISFGLDHGEILALVSFPSYENNRMARIIPGYYYEQLVTDPLNPLLNHAVGDVLPVGSVFKLVTAVGGLNEGVVDVDHIV
mgnify:FL=1